MVYGMIELACLNMHIHVHAHVVKLLLVYSEVHALRVFRFAIHA